MSRSPHSHRFGLAAIVLLLLVVAFAPPLIRTTRLRNRITHDVSEAIGRPVRADSVELQLLPRAAIVMNNVAVGDDPGFSAEPLLQAPVVTAHLRLLPLLRGELRIARITLEEPSLNITRAPDGRWSLQNLLVRAARSANAAETSGRQQTMPYIEASGARVNLKLGQEKTPFSLLDVDFTWAQQPGGRGQIRLSGRPARTDREVGDGGMVRVLGTMTSAPTLDEVALDLNAEWNQVQMGELTGFALGRDSGWRGTAEMQVKMKGPVRDVEVTSRVRIFGLRRTEFVPPTSLDPVLDCSAKFAHSLATLRNLLCTLPAGASGSAVEIGGTVSLAQPLRASNIDIGIRNLPASVLLEAAQHVRPDLASRLGAEGSADGSFHWDGQAWHGSASFPMLTLSSPRIVGTLRIENLRMDAGERSTPRPLRTAKAAPAAIASPPNTFRLEPVVLDLHGSSPLTVAASFDANGYTVKWTGSAALQRLSLLAELAPALRRNLQLDRVLADSTDNPDTSPDMDLVLSAPWNATRTRGVQMTGTIRVRSADYRTPLLQNALRLSDVSGVFSNDATVWTGSAQYLATRVEGRWTIPQNCTTDSPCPQQFALRTPQVDLGAALDGQSTGILEGPLRRLLEAVHITTGPNDLWPPAIGTVHAGTLTIGRLVAHDADAALAFSGHMATIRSLQARAMGGRLALEGEVDAVGTSPRCRLQFSLRHVDVAQAAALFREDWGRGAGDADATITATANSLRDLAANAAGTFRFDLRQGALRSETAAIAFDRWTAQGVVRDQHLVLQQSELTRADRQSAVTGTIGFDRGLQLKMEEGRQATLLNGTLSAAVVSSTP